MSKRMKIILSALAVAVVLSIGAAVTVMAKEPPESLANNGLITRVAQILNITPETLINAFKQARGQIQQENFDKLLAKLVEQKKLTQAQVDQINTWLSQKPAFLTLELARTFGFPKPNLGKAVQKGIITQAQADQITTWWGQRPDFLKEDLLRQLAGYLKRLHQGKIRGFHKGWEIKPTSAVEGG